MPSICQLAREWQEAQHVLRVIGDREAAVAAEAARRALAEAVKQKGAGADAAGKFCATGVDNPLPGWNN